MPLVLRRETLGLSASKKQDQRKQTQKAGGKAVWAVKEKSLSLKQILEL